MLVSDFKVGDRVVVKETAGFAIGAQGVVVKIEEDHNRIYVRQDGQSEKEYAGWFLPKELEVDARARDDEEALAEAFLHAAERCHVALNTLAKAPPRNPPSEIRQVLSERGKRYGDFGTHAAITQALKDVARSYPGWARLSPAQKEAMDMTFHKYGRALNGDPTYDDNFVDATGYNQLVVDDMRRQA